MVNFCYCLKPKQDKPAAPKPVTTPTSPDVSKGPIVINGLVFPGSVEEARKNMNKKKDVKGASMSVKDKYELFQKL